MKFCSNCGHPSEEGKKFCVKCGNSLQTGAEQTPQGGYQQAPQGGLGQVPQGGVGQVPQGGVGQAPQGGYQQAPQEGLGQVPQGGYQQVPQGGVGQVPQGGVGQAPQGGVGQVPQGGLGQVPQGGLGQVPQGGYQQVPQGGYQQAPVKKKKSPLLVLGIVGIFACGLLGAAYLLGDDTDGGVLSVFQPQPDLEPFPYDLSALVDRDALMTAVEEEDEAYFEEWLEELEEIPEEYYQDLAIGAGSIAAVYIATNFDSVADEMMDLSDDFDLPTDILDELYDLSDEIWNYIPSELDSMTITWDTSMRAKSGEIPFALEVNGEEFVPDDTVSEEDMEDLLHDRDPSDWTLDEMLDLLSVFYFVAEEELEYMVENDSDNEIFDYLYASTSWAKVEPFVLEIERTSSRSFDVYTSSAHWAQLDFSYKNGKVSETMDVAPLVAGVLVPQYMAFVESSREQSDMSAANELCKVMTIALATTEGDHSDVSITWSSGGGLVYSDPDSKFSKEVQATLGNLPRYSSEFGQNNPITLGISYKDGVPFVYVDRSCDSRWAEDLSLSYGP